MQEVLSAAGHRVDVSGASPPGRVSRAVAQLRSFGRPWDLNIHTERAVVGWMDLSRLNVLLPNPEWFDPSPAFARMDAILCKTRWTEEVMSRMHPRTFFTGFTSLDRRKPGVTPDEPRPLHVVGSSPNKGTSALMEVWKQNPKWPVLRVLAWKHGLGIPEATPANVQVSREFVDDSRLHQLQAACGFHVCPSAAEGFGHTVVEGMSTGALVLTTDAPPMNELVSAERGLLVPWITSEPLRAGRRFEVDPVRLGEKIAEALAAPPALNRAIGSAAREWYEQNDAEFRRRFVEVIGDLLQ